MTHAALLCLPAFVSIFAVAWQAGPATNLVSVMGRLLEAWPGLGEQQMPSEDLAHATRTANAL